MAKKRTVILATKVEPSEAEQIKENAKKRGITTSEFLRRTALSIELPKTKKQECDLKQLIYEVNKIGINLNQIARYVNTNKELDISVLEHLKRIEEELYLLLETVKQSAVRREDDTD